MSPDETLEWLGAGRCKVRVECCNPDCSRVVELHPKALMRFGQLPLSRFRMQAHCRACGARGGVKVYQPQLVFGQAKTSWVEMKTQARRRHGSQTPEKQE